jgi:hypothetical protein
MMTLRHPSQADPNRSMHVLMIALALAFALVLAAVAALPALHDIPFTRHAQEGHLEQQWNATIIAARLSSRSCKPILAFSCERTTIVMCPVDDPNDLWTGLIIGTQTDLPVIVTGYAAPRSY